MSGFTQKWLKVFSLSCCWSFVLALTGLAGEQLQAAENAELVVYSARKEYLIKPLFDQYTEETGVKIRYITDKAGPLLTRLKSEGASTQADMLLTVDVGNLWHAANQGVLREINSSTLSENVPANLRDPENRWFGLTVRARTLVYSTERVKPADLLSYEDLADKKWKDRLCLRTSKKVYNQSLVASLLANLGKTQTEQVISGWVANLATSPFSNDTKAMQAVISGLCDVTIVNTYYFGRLQKQDANLPLALFWPNQRDHGVHINISGGGVTRHAKHPEQAQKLLEWLSDEKAQGLLASLNQEYPVNKKVPASAEVLAWGEFKADPVALATVAENQVEAVKLIDRMGYR